MQFFVIMFKYVDYFYYLYAAYTIYVNCFYFYSIATLNRSKEFVVFM